jgi:hypothetical protein
LRWRLSKKATRNKAASRAITVMDTAGSAAGGPVGLVVGDPGVGVVGRVVWVIDVAGEPAVEFVDPAVAGSSDAAMGGAGVVIVERTSQVTGTFVGVSEELAGTAKCENGSPRVEGVRCADVATCGDRVRCADKGKSRDGALRVDGAKCADAAENGDGVRCADGAEYADGVRSDGVRLGGWAKREDGVELADRASGVGWVNGGAGCAADRASAEVV